MEANKFLLVLLISSMNATWLGFGGYGTGIDGSCSAGTRHTGQPWRPQFLFCMGNARAVYFVLFTSPQWNWKQQNLLVYHQLPFLMAKMKKLPLFLLPFDKLVNLSSGCLLLLQPFLEPLYKHKKHGSTAAWHLKWFQMFRGDFSNSFPLLNVILIFKLMTDIVSSQYPAPCCVDMTDKEGSYLSLPWCLPVDLLKLIREPPREGLVS